MASISVQFSENDSISTDPVATKDLSKTFQNLLFILDGQLNALLNQPLSAVPHGTKGTLTLDAGNPSWTLDGSPATFSLRAKATATVTIHSQGALFNYYRDFGDTDLQPCFGKADSVYVITEFGFNISGKVYAAASTGNIGVTTDDSGSVSYAVRNYKAFPPGKQLREALLEAVAAFTLPLHLNTINNLGDADCIYYEFDGALNVGFGLTYGIDASGVDTA